MSRFSIDVPPTMAAVQLIAHGGPETLRYALDVPTPCPAAGEVLIAVSAAGVNNTDINTRIGWYSSEATQGTAEATKASLAAESGDWTGGGLHFPRIQGADVCGAIVGVGEGVSPERLGERVIVQSCLLSLADGPMIPWLGSERDGAFAQFVCAPSADTYAVLCDLSDAELAAIPCAYATAENLISRAGVAAGETVLITGASGNVGLAAVQLAARRGARVIALAAPSKFAALEAVGATRCLPRDADLEAILGPGAVDAVIDVVGGPQWPKLLEALRIRGRYAVSGAIAGPLVELDLRKLYLKDLTLFGCTAQDKAVFPALVGYLERGEIRPLVARTYPLRDIAAAQEEFLEKGAVGKIILIPPALP